ncbi:MAG: hypothetical protein MJE68_08030 [Proteobacteria bacterium]|nr:hypothetical protein [Pseudomonadota bacterium]
MKMLNTMLAGLAVSSFILLGGTTLAVSKAVADDKSFSYSLSFDGITYSYGESDNKYGKRKWYGVTPHFHSHPPRFRYGYRFSHHPRHRHAPSQTRYYYRDGSRADVTYYDTDDGYSTIYEYEEGESYSHSDEVVYYYDYDEDYDEDVHGEIHYYYGEGGLLDATTDIGVGLIDATTGLATDVIDGVGYLLFGD